MLRNSKEVVAVEMPLDFEGCDQLHLTFPTGAVNTQFLERCMYMHVLNFQNIAISCI